MADFIVIILVALALITIAAVFISWRRPRFSKNDLRQFQTEWLRIKKEQDLKKAVLEADKLLDFVLKKRGYNGNLGQKLKDHGQLFSNLNHVWQAHKARNKIAHELGFNFSKQDGARYLRYFEQALRDIKAL